MYEELVKRLRAQAEAERFYVGEEMLYSQAADAIEELDTLLDGVSADNDALCETIERLKKPRWIPVTERLPEDGERVLIHSGDYVGCGLYTGAFWKDEDHDYVIVTHWMPLPTPPKEKT